MKSLLRQAVLFLWGNQNSRNLFKKHASHTQPKALSEDSDHSGCSDRVCFMNAGSAKHHRVDDITAQSSGWDGVWALWLELHKMLLATVLCLSYFQLNRYSYQTTMCPLSNSNRYALWSPEGLLICFLFKSFKLLFFFRSKSMSLH